MISCMKSSEIINYFDKKFKKTKYYYNRLLENFAIEDIHGYRLEMKKLRAFIRLLNSNIPEEKKIKIGRNTKLLYKTTGNIRNLQLHQLRVSKLCNEMLLEKPVPYLQRIHNEENKQKNKARQIAEKISFNHFQEKLIAFASDKLNIESMETFVIQKKRALLKLIFLVNYTDIALHEIRKVLKDLMYNWKCITSLVPTTLPAYFTNKKNIDLFTKKLGEFNDLCIAVRFLKHPYINKIVDEKEKNILLLVRMQLEDTRGEMKKEINTLLGHIKQEM